MTVQPVNPRDLAMRRARAALDVGRPRDALRLVGPVIAAEPSHSEALLVAARAHLLLDEFGPQYAAATAALRLTPNHPDALLLAGIAAGQLRHHAEAQALLRRAVQAAPNAWITHATLAQNLAERRSTRWQAWEFARRAVELAPDEAEAHCSVGHVALQRRNFTVAEQAFRRALELDPSNATALNDLSLVLARTGRAREAAGGFTAALAVDPQLAEARHNLDYLTVQTIWRFHLAMWIGVFIDLRVLASGSSGRGVAAVVAAVSLAVAVWTVWRSHYGTPRTVLRYAASFPRRDPVRAGWAACCLIAFVGMLGCVVLPAAAAQVAVWVAAAALVVGVVLSWTATGADASRGRARR